MSIRFTPSIELLSAGILISVRWLDDMCIHEMGRGTHLKTLPNFFTMEKIAMH